MIKSNSEDADLDEVLRKYFTSKFRSGYVTAKGVTMPERFAEMQEEIYNLEVNENDVWVCSFPKTGTTWTLEMVWMIMNNLDFIKGQENIETRCPFLELSAIFDHRQNIKTIKDFDAPAYLQDSIKFLKEVDGPKCVKTHIPWVLLPRELQENIKKPKIIYVTRNPKDTCVSYYNHCRLLEGYTGDFEDFCRLFLAGKVAYAPFWDHVFPFWERRTQPNVLFLKYEDMINDLPSVIRKVAQFLERNLTDEQIDKLTNHLCFENMKNNNSVNYHIMVNFLRKHNMTSSVGSFMRSGKIGGATSHMSADVIMKFEKWTKENLKDSDFSF
ncbi:sulfotransferase family cytosolic 1B member 1-like [Anoplophora glabripennis]|uniref:sulfotransferase family cytosolic 1B member 1-like n=1 Tax=Anoplophora glabripennis TaxID=217634 RepID=UPI0008759DCB|nr:sulfotransferase family cytosolic 1B member 1-like [Anoplophora glabripennis]